MQLSVASDLSDPFLTHQHWNDPFAYWWIDCER